MTKLMLLMVALISQSASAGFWTDPETGKQWQYRDIYGAMAIVGVKPATGDLVVPPVILGEPVESIESSAFSYCKDLMSVVIPDGVTYIGNRAFEGCENLKEVVVGKSVEEIGENVFYGCINLTKVVFRCDYPARADSLRGIYDGLSDELVTYIGAANGWDGFLLETWWQGRPIRHEMLKRDCFFYYVDGAGRTAVTAYDGPVPEDLTIPSWVNRVDDYAFYCCDTVRTVLFDQPKMGSFEIGDSAFGSCANLESVTFTGSPLVVLCGHTFCGCAKLLSVDGLSSRINQFKGLGCDFQGTAYWDQQPDGFVGMGCWLLGYKGECPKEISIPTWAYHIAGHAFFQTEVETVMTHDHVYSIGDYAFAETCTLSSFEWPAGLEYIGSGAFTHSRLTDVALPQKVLSIGDYAFSMCGDLESASIPEGVYHIGEYAFRGAALTSMTVPSSVRTMGLSAFYECSRLEYVFFKGDCPFYETDDELAALWRSEGLMTWPKTIVFSGKEKWERSVMWWMTDESEQRKWLGNPIVFLPERSTVIFDLNGLGERVGGGELEQVVACLEFAFVPEVRANDGWRFSGWNGDVAKRIMEDEYFLAQYELEHYSITYKADDGSINQNPTTYTVEDEIVFAPLDDTDGREFVRWEPDRIAAGTTGDITIKAVWKPIVYSSIAYENLCGAMHSNPSTYREGTSVVFAFPGPRTGYAFCGWSPAAITADTAGDVTVTATWRANNYRIVYHANGGSGTTDATMCAYDAESVIASNNFVREGYVFKGWATKTGGAVVYQPGRVVMNLTDNEGGEITLYAVWERIALALPVISPAGGTEFWGDVCQVSITCETEGATIYCSTRAAPRGQEREIYNGTFVIAETTTIYAFAKIGDQRSAVVQATIVKRVKSLAEVVDVPTLSVTTGGDAEWRPVADVSATGGWFASCGRIFPAEDGCRTESWMEVAVEGAGTLSFRWRVDCEEDGINDDATWDCLAYFVDGVAISAIDGQTAWASCDVSFVEDGIHRVRWVYSKDDMDDENYEGEDCGWVDCVVWTPCVAPEVRPSIEKDPGATVTGDPVNGFVVKPSEGKTVVEVTIPQGVDAAKVTVEVSPKVASVKPNGAKVKVVSCENDITDCLVIPESDGVMNIAAATVKKEIVKEALDPSKDAVIELNAANPRLTTAPTRKGLTYALFEGRELKSLSKGDSKLGDGEPWTPTISVSGGDAAFYSINVSK